MSIPQTIDRAPLSPILVPVHVTQAARDASESNGTPLLSRAQAERVVQAALAAWGAHLATAAPEFQVRMRWERVGHGKASAGRASTEGERHG